MRGSEWIEGAACKSAGLLAISDNEVDQRYFIDVFCTGCPVVDSCEEDATKDDFRFTVRSGRMPGTYRGKKKPRYKQSTILKPFCVNGHPTPNASDREASGQCKQCRKEYKLKKAAEGWAHKYGKMCANGKHVLGPGSISKYGYCTPCHTDAHREAKKRRVQAVQLTDEHTSTS